MMAKLPAFGLLAGAAALLLPAIPQAAAQSTHTVVIQQADPNDTARTRIRNGVEVLRATDEEHTNEQATFAFDPINKSVGVVVMMSTGQLDGPLGPNTGDQIQIGNIQGACMPILMTPDATAPSGVTLVPQVTDFRYISQRNSDENRAYHHPEIEAIGNNLFAVTANWDRNNNTNTERYMQVVDSKCNLLPLTANVTLRENNTSAMIMAKNNDNCSGKQAGGGATIEILGDGTVMYSAHELCNGNGQDDGWMNYLQLSCAADGSTCDIQKLFDTSVITREERSRGRCEMIDTDASGTSDMSVCCGTEGNSQPQREGVWCAGVDHATGDLLWRERVAYEGETADGRRTYAMRMKMLQVRDLAGKGNGQLAMQWNMHRGNNNNDQKGGYDDKLEMAIANPTRAGLNAAAPQDITQAVINSGAEMTHATMFQTFVGTPYNAKPVFGFLSPNHNGGGGVSAKIMNISLENGVFASAPTTALSGPSDGQKYSKYLGNNPNNQGRNFMDCHVTANPFVNTPGPSQGIPVLNMCALTGKMTSAGIPSIKPDLFFEIWASVVPEATPEPDPEPDPGNGGGDPEPDPEPDPGDGTGGGSSGGVGGVGGCSASSSSTGGSAALVLLGLGFVCVRRRRRS